ncbi:MAG: 50S ribosomal protein L17 [Candidatus Ancillula sp.]|jgi:large subunit ribosomal protein L17|nr:50S ribosomal protein L17 [Candidatus Ancillula sp.]
MVTPTKGARLGSSPAHERLILSNLATELFRHSKIKTTFVRAKRLQPVAEHLITIAKKGTLAARRQILTKIRDKGITELLMTVIAEDFKDRNGGYTRIVRIENRKGDQAKMAVIELVSDKIGSRPVNTKESVNVQEPVVQVDETVSAESEEAVDTSIQVSEDDEAKTDVNNAESDKVEAEVENPGTKED